MIQEQYSRRNCLRIHGMKETPNESTDDLALNLALGSLKIYLSLEHIDRSHRITPRLKAKCVSVTTNTRAQTNYF